MQKQTPPARLYRCFSVARASITGALLGGFALVGCSELTVVQTPPVQLTDKVYGFACSHWANSAPPPVARTLFDLRLWQESTETQPAPALVAAIEGAGGRVVYSFHGPMIRAELDVAAVPALYGAGSALNYAATVTDPGAHDVTLIVMLDHDLTDKDLNAARAVGGQITHEFHALEGYVVVIDDAHVSDIRALPGVLHAGFNSVGCLD